MTQVYGVLDEIAIFHDRRRKGIGATDAAPILGISRWGTAFEVWEAKLGLDSYKEPSLSAFLGNYLQNAVAELYTSETGIKVRRDNRQHQHPVHDWMLCHLDYREHGNPKHLIECKTTHRYDDWGTILNPKIPVDVWVQCQHEMAVTGAESCDVAVLFGHRAFSVLPVQRDDDFIGKLIMAEEEFWTQCVLTETPPAIDGSEAARRFLNRRNPDDNGLMIPLTPEQARIGEQYRLSLHNLASVKEAHQKLKNEIIEMIGPMAGVRGPDFEVTYKKTKDSTHVNWQGIAQAYERLLDDMPALALARVFAEHGFAEQPWSQVNGFLHSVNTSKEEGVRKFWWTDKKEAEE